MARYEVTGTGEATGRQRKRVYEAQSATQARQQAEKAGTLVSAVVVLPPEQPTDGQLQTAREHGIDIPAGVNRDELSDLISIKTWRDKQASPNLRDIAEGYGVKVTKYSGKRLLFQRIFDCISQPGHEDDMAAWFAYRVYRELVGGTDDSPVKSPNDSLIKSIASKLSADSSVICSIRRYRGTDLVWFGEWASPSGTIHQGGSNRTIAYKRAAELLRPFASSEKRTAAVNNAKRYSDRPAPPTSEVATEPTKIGAWLARAEEAMRVQNGNPVKITHWHVAVWAVLAVMLGLIVFGP